MKPLESIHGQGPQSLAAPVPNQAENQSVPQGMPAPMSAPVQAMEPQAQASPVPAEQDDSEAQAMAALQSLGSSTPPQAGQPGPTAPSAIPTDDEQQAMHALHDLAKAPAKFTETDLTKDYGVVRDTNGSMKILGEGGQLRDPTKFEKNLASVAAKVFRIAGPVGGAVVGSAVGALGGPAAPVTIPAGEAAGSLAGGELVHKQASLLEELAGEVPEDRGLLHRAADFFAPGVGKIGAKVISKVGGAALPGIAKVEGQALAEKGQQTLAAEAVERKALSEKTKVPLTESEITPEPKDTLMGEKHSSGTLQLVGRAQNIVDGLESIRNKIGPKLTEQEAQNFSSRDLFESIRTSTENKIGELKQKSYNASGDAKIPELGQNARQAVMDTLADNDARPSLRVREFLNKTEANGYEGVSHKEFDQLMTGLGNEANFGAQTTNEKQIVARKIYGRLMEVRDDALEKTFTKAGPEYKNALSELQEQRRFYSENKEDLLGFVNKFKNDPDLFESAKIMSKKDTTQLNMFLNMAEEASPGKRNEIRRAIADEIFKGPKGQEVTRQNLDVDGIRSRMNSIPSKNRKVIFDEAMPEIQNLLNIAELAKSNPAALKQAGSLKNLDKIEHSKFDFVKDNLKFILQSVAGKQNPLKVGAGTAAVKAAPEVAKGAVNTLGELLSTQQGEQTQ